MIRKLICLFGLLALLGCAPTTMDPKPDGGMGGTGVSDKM